MEGVGGWVGGKVIYGRVATANLFPPPTPTPSALNHFVGERWRCKKGGGGLDLECKLTSDQLELTPPPKKKKMRRENHRHRV